MNKFDVLQIFTGYYMKLPDVVSAVLIRNLSIYFNMDDIGLGKIILLKYWFKLLNLMYTYIP